MHYATQTEEAFYKEIRWFVPGDEMRRVEQALTGAWWEKRSELENTMVLTWAGYLAKLARGEEVRIVFAQVPVFVSHPHRHLLEYGEQEGFDAKDEADFRHIDNVYEAFNVVRLAAMKEHERAKKVSHGPRDKDALRSLGAAHNYRQIGRRAAQHYGFTKEGWEASAF